MADNETLRIAAIVAVLAASSTREDPAQAAATAGPSGGGAVCSARNIVPAQAQAQGLRPGRGEG